ncbi:DUF2637 domain-containing protein [Pseudonocardia nigra]|uniref:DUF2637 domain-containing protein n=1 Tax=Pseudonocardia nigra TaxID=1921578 RepID=UPI001C5FD2D2
MTVDPLLQSPPCPAPSRELTAEHTGDERRLRPTARKGWARVWPSLLAAVTLPAVGGPAAVASYRHARDVIAEHGDPVMAPWLALTTDGMLLAALVVIWIRRHRREPVGAGPWAAFWAGMATTFAANLAAAQPTPVGIVVALWPPVCLAITLELIALVASPPKHHPMTDTVPPEWSAHVPDHAQPAPGHGHAVTSHDERARGTGEVREAGEPGRHQSQPRSRGGRVACSRLRARARCCARGHSSGNERACARAGARLVRS